MYRRYALWNKSFVPPPPPGLKDKLWTCLTTYENFWLGGFLLALVGVVVIFGLPVLLMGVTILVFLTIFVAYPFIVLSSSTAYGLAAANHISDSIAVEKTQGRYVFMALTPYGRIGTAWAMTSITLHTHPSLQAIRHNLLRSYAFLGLFVGFCFGIPWVGALLFSLVTGEMLITLSATFWMLDLLVVIVIVYVDYLQSTVIGVLLGMLMPEMAKTRLDIRNLTTSTFMILQLSAYIFIAIVCGFGLPHLYQMADWPLLPTLPVACLVVFYAVRDLLITVLWLMLAWHTNARLDEVEVVTRVDIRHMPGWFIVRRIATWINPRWPVM